MKLRVCSMPSSSAHGIQRHNRARFASISACNSSASAASSGRRWISFDSGKRNIGPVSPTAARSAPLAFAPVHTLVTGGAGFIGSNLVEALIARGDTVAVLDNLTTGNRANVAADARLHEADVRDEDAVDGVFAERAPELVFHLAAQIDVRKSVASPAFDAGVNVGGTAVMLEAARRYGVRRFVLASTGGALYGEAETTPTNEAAAIAPLSPYGAGKAAAESYCALFSRLHGLSTASLRLANVYGLRQDPRGEAGVVALFCAARLDGRDATVFGDGSQTRDYVFVGDVVAAFIAAALSSATGEFNIGTGVETSVLELAAALELAVVHAPERLGEVRRSCLDASAARAELSWSAGTTLADGLQQTLAWARTL
jgi:UDP-glucose 4-epimerase